MMTVRLKFAVVLTVLMIALATPTFAQPAAGRLTHRWLFIYSNVGDPAQVDKAIALFPRARRAGYNGVVFPWNVASEKVAEFTAAAKRYGLDLIPLVMEGSRDQNNAEGVPARDVLFVAHGGVARFQSDNPTRLLNGDFETVAGNRFSDWTRLDTEGVRVVPDHEVVHGGKTSVRMENFAAGPHGRARLLQHVKLQPFRQYHISVWVKSEDLKAGEAGVEVLAPKRDDSICYQTFRVRGTQDWTHYDLGFNSLNHTEANVYLGVWGGRSGRIWWDDLALEEVGLVNVLRRPGCPVTVRGENGAVYTEGKDFEQIVDPNLHIWRAYHTPPNIILTPHTRIKEGERLRVTYYHPVLIYNGRVSYCLSEPAIFDEWRAEVKEADRRYHPKAFFMYHDEIRVANWCEACQSQHKTPGQLLAENVRRAAQIIRTIRPDAEIWDWNDMFDPMQNAQKHYYLCHGSMEGGWEGLDKGIGIVNWYGELNGKNAAFFADRGEQQILAGYYDHDEDGSAIARWEAATKNTPGIVGAMYTTWRGNYDAMEAWAAAAWGGGEGREVKRPGSPRGTTHAP